jgi:hypothetical protein
MRRRSWPGLVTLCTAAALLPWLAWSTAVEATPPSTPIAVELSLSHVPAVNEWTTATVRVTSVLDAPGTVVELVLPPDLAAPTNRWILDLRANTPVTLSSPVFAQAAGNTTVGARAVRVAGPHAVWGDMKSVAMAVGSPVAGPSARGWRVTHVPVATLARPGAAAAVSAGSTPFSFPAFAPRATGTAPDGPPATVPRETPRAPAGPPSSPGSVTLTGRWRYADRSLDPRDSDQQLLEVRRGDGTPLSPRQYCFTSVDGTFACTLPHPGTTMRVWIWSWTSFAVPGAATDRLGVFSGPEVIGGCGSDSIDCAYPVQTGEVACADGATCDVGTWVMDVPEPWMGAHWMTQDLIRAWKKLFFDVTHGPALSAGPARITYPVAFGHGTHAHVPPGDGWISVEPPNQLSADIVLHEHGHVVMANLWDGFVPNWPPFDCSLPHFISLPSGPGCALFEGFADFWAWYANEVYDGDGESGNEGPVFNWPGGAFSNLETRDGGTYEPGDLVEGNVAAVLGDVLDVANDGPDSGPADRLMDGIAHVWHALAAQSSRDFADWFRSYWQVFAHDPCPVLRIVNFASIDYALTQCGGPADSMAPAVTVISTPVASNSVTFHWSATDDATPSSALQYRYRLDGVDAWSAWGSATRKRYAGLPTGTRTFRVEARDLAGNSAVGTTSISVSTPCPERLIADNLAPGQKSRVIDFTGTWVTAPQSGSHGSPSLLSAGAGTDTYTWRLPVFSATQACRYRVSVWWTPGANRSPSVPYVVIGASRGSQTKHFDQRQGGRRWTEHGTYTFGPSRSARVRVSDRNGRASADAVRFLLVP